MLSLSLMAINNESYPTSADYSRILRVVIVVGDLLPISIILN
ncbi:hypothetical protein AXX16_1771 [Serratia rubidaea]|nr:hypothetical protein AXX16_1771 [Serratia rubidaea]